MIPERVYKRRKFWRGVSNVIWTAVISAVILGILAVAFHGCSRYARMVDSQI